MSDLETKSAEDLAREVKEDFNKKLDAVKEVAEKALKSAEGLTKSEKEKADETLTAMNEAKARLDDIEQKMARAPAGEEQHKSLGQRFVESEEYKSGIKDLKSNTRISMAVKADITTANAGNAGDAGAAIVPNRLPGIQELPQQRLTIRNLLSPGHTDSPIVQFTQESGFTNNAATVKEGEIKPQSDIKFAEKEIGTKVIAHWMRATKQILSDAPQLRSFIDARLIYGLQLAEERQLLNGDGSAENLHGIIPQATAFKVPTGLSSPTPTTGIDVLRIAMLQAALAEYPATGHVLNPIDWASIELLKDTEGRYIIGNPQGTLSPTLWSLPVVTTQSIQVGKFLTGAFKLGAQIFDQWAGRIEAGLADDDFIRNKVTILAEERLALAVYRPEAFVYGSITPSAGGGN